MISSTSRLIPEKASFSLVILVDVVQNGGDGIRLAIDAGLATGSDIRSLCAELTFAALGGTERVAIRVAVTECILVPGVAYGDLSVTASALAGDPQRNQRIEFRVMAN